jgi:hypothetical protein
MNTVPTSSGSGSATLLLSMFIETDEDKQAVNLESRTVAPDLLEPTAREATVPDIYYPTKHPHLHSQTQFHSVTPVIVLFLLPVVCLFLFLLFRHLSL